MRSSWIFLFLCFWAWRLAAEPNITFPKDTKLTAPVQNEIVSTLVKSCAIATDYAHLTLVDEVVRENQKFNLYNLTFNVQYESTDKTDEINLRIRDYEKSGGEIEIFDIHSNSGQCFYRGVFVTKVYNDAGIGYEAWMQGLESIKRYWNVDEINLKFRFAAYDSKNFLNTEKRIAELVWRELFAVSGVEPFPCGVVFKGEYKSRKTQDGYLVNGQGEKAVDTCYNQQVAKTWMYSVRVRLNEDNKTGEIELISSRKPQSELLLVP